MKEWFKARNVWGAVFESLPDADAGQLAKALWVYTMTGAETELSGSLRSVFAMFRFQLDLDDEQTRELSEIRAASGRKGGRPPKSAADPENPEKAKKTIALFASDENQTEAKLAIAPNKNKNKNKNNILDDDDDDARADAVTVEAFREHFGRLPTPAELSGMNAKAAATQTPPDLIHEAIRIAAANGAKSPLAYISRLLMEWADEYIKTPAELAEYQFLQDAAAGRNHQGTADIEDRIEAARAARMEKHAREGAQ